VRSSLPDGPLPVHQPNCLGCGPENPCGLHLVLRKEGDHVRGPVTFAPTQEGSPGVAHGGAVAVALDDVMGTVLKLLRRPAVTASLTVDYRAPVILGVPYELDAWCDEVDGRKLHLRGTVSSLDGALVAEARALFIAVPLEHFTRGGRPVPPEWSGWEPAAD
jgi:acyl-coenzyme A thioesterase PaaI-like protein